MPTRWLTAKRWRRIQEIGLGYLLLAPALTILLVFDFFPIFFGAFISTCDWKPAAAIGAETVLERWLAPCVKFVGFDNYLRAFNDSQMWQSLFTTATYALIALPLQLGLALFFAYLLFQNVRGKEIFRVIFFLPYITSEVASAAVWSFLYNPDKGLINNVLIRIGVMDPDSVWKWLGEPTGVFALMARSAGITLPEWLAGPSLALIAVIFYTTWVFDVLAQSSAKRSRNAPSDAGRIQQDQSVRHHGESRNRRCIVQRCVQQDQRGDSSRRSTRNFGCLS